MGKRMKGRGKYLSLGNGSFTVLKDVDAIVIIQTQEHLSREITIADNAFKALMEFLNEETEE